MLCHRPLPTGYKVGPGQAWALVMPAPWDVFIQWQSSTDRWDKLGHQIVKIIDVMTAAHKRNKMQRAADTAALRAQQQAHDHDIAGMPNTADPEPAAPDDSDDSDGFEEELFEPACIPNHPADEGTSPDDLAYLVCQLLGDDPALHPSSKHDTSKRAYFDNAMAGLPEVNFGDIATQQDLSSCISRNVNTTRRKAVQEAAQQQEARAAARAQPLAGQLCVLQNGQLFLLHPDTEPTPIDPCLQWVKLHTPPSVEETAVLFTLSAEQAFAFFLKAAALLKDMKENPQRMIVVGEPGTGKSQVLKAFTWFAFQHSKSDTVLPTSFAWRAALHISNDVHPPRSTHHAFGLTQEGKMVMKKAAGLAPIENVELDEFTFVSPKHFNAANANANKVKLNDYNSKEVFGHMNVTLYGDPCQRTPVAQRPMWNPLPSSVKDVAGNAVYKQFQDVIYLVEQQRTTCRTLYDHSRLFMRSEANPATLEEVTRFVEDLNSKVVTDTESLAAQVPRAIIIRNDVRSAINMRLGTMHARHLKARPILWRNVDRPSKGEAMNDVAATNARLMSASNTNLMPTLGMLFPGCLNLFSNNDLPTAGVAKNATCVVRGVVLHEQEPEDPKTGAAWFLRHPPRAVFVEPQEGKLDAQTVEAMREKYPDLPDNCFVVEAMDTKAFEVYNSRISTSKPKSTERAQYSRLVRYGIPLAEGYAVTDHYCQGANFKKQTWLAHLTPPPRTAGTFERASVFVTTTRWQTWEDVKLLAPLWDPGAPGGKSEAVQRFLRATVMSEDLHTELDRLKAAAAVTKLKHAPLWQLAQQVCHKRCS